MSFGLPIVTTAESGIEVSHEDNCLVCNAGSAIELANNIIRLTGDEDLRKRLGVNAARQIKEKYSWEIYAQSVKNVYKVLTNKDI